MEIYVKDDRLSVTAKASTRTNHTGVTEEDLASEEHCLLQEHHGDTYIQERDAATFDAIAVRSNNEDVNLQGTNDHRTYDQHSINRA